uniref:Titin n=1 Tax=Caenorhabditis tropicalis TaxID=1561998 RepID=A0A1I7TDW1_9PELO
MVIPSNRPPPPPQPVKMFTGVRRRPPLNRACPPIPESKSNESIMSHASKISEHQKATTSTETTADLVIENRNVVDILHRLDANSNISSSQNTRKSKEKKIKMSSTPRSPLMNMANSVKSKLTKITHLGRSSESNSSSNIKTSQSFSGIRQPKQVPKRIDQNANRVIKSSSMEVPSTSKVCIPQDPTPLVDDKIEEISEAGLISKSEMAPPKPMEHVCVKLEEDVLVVTKEFDERYPGQKRSASPDPPTVFESQTTSEFDRIPSEQIVETFSEELDNNANQKTPGPVRRVIKETTTTVTTTSFSESSSSVPIIEKMEITKNEEKEEKIEEKTEVFAAAEIENHPEITSTDVNIPASVQASETIQSPKKERFTSPERYILLVKTPEALRKHRTLTIGEKDPSEVKSPELEESIQYTKLETVKFKETKEKIKYEETVPKEKFILTVKTPEAIRRHHTFTIRDKSPEEMRITKSQSDVHVSKKLMKQVSEPERKTVEKDLMKEEKEEEDVVPQPKFVIVMKTPECLRRHHTFTIGDRPKSPDYPYIEEGEITEPIATIGPPADRRKKEEEKEKKRKEWEEYEKPPKEKYILTTTTPLAIRKYQTFVVESKEEKQIPQSMSADAVMMTKKGKIQRSESTDSKKHSYLRRLQFELFRGRSRERKTEKQEKRQKSLDERKPESAQKYILSTTTPIMMRKYQTFAIVDSKPKKEETNLESIESAYHKEMSFDEEKTTSPVKTSDFYSITATTPLAKRRVLLDEPATSSIQQISLDEAIGSPTKKQISPEPRHLFVMGGRRSTTPQEERKSEKLHEPPKNLKLDTDRSQSDNAELLEERKSTMSGDLTSPEEEIPMDTNLTPTTEEVMEAVIISRRIEGLMTSPIEEEPEGITSSIRDLSIKSLENKRNSDSERPAPVFTPPSPPKEMPFVVMTVPKSTSTSSSDSAIPMTSSSSSTRIKPTQLPIKKTIQVVDPMHIVELKPEQKSKKKHSLQSEFFSISVLSLRNAGKMLTPSFLRKEKKGPKKALYPKTTSNGRQHISEKMERKAPLAEGESSVVANSPLVENLPITFEKWSNKSPRLSVKHFSETIIEEGLDANANSMSPQLEHRVIPTSHHAAQDNTGLIDDDIIDQPMLVGDTFSHSSSIDCISAHQRMNESIISIDRSLAQNESRSTNQNTQNNANRNAYIESNLDRQIDAGRSEVQDIKTQLQKLNRLVNEMGVSGWEEELTRLRRENEQLRRELAERDATIAALQSQTVSS